MNEEILGLLGLTPEQIAQYRQQSAMAGLGSLGQALIQAGSPRQGPRQGTLAGIAQALPAYGAGQQASMDQVLQNILRQRQMQQMIAQQQAQQQAQKRQEFALGRLRSATQQITPEAALGMPGRVGPTADRAGMIGQTPVMTRDMALQFGLDPDLPEGLRKSLFDYAQATKPAEPKAAPGVVGEYEAAKASGAISPNTSFEQFMAMKKPPAAVATAISGGKPDTFSEEVKKLSARSFVEIENSGLAARRASADINRLDNLLSKVETGGAAAFKQAAGNFGIKTEGLDDIQAAQAIINKLVPAQRPPGSGTMSDADLELYKQSLPRIINQPGANREIIRSMREINQYLIKEGQIAAEVTAGRITPEEGRSRMMTLGNPIQDFFARTQQPAVPRGQPRVNPQDNSLILKYLRPGQ